MKRPDVDKVNGLSPVIAIGQKTTSKNPRSTVGTVTELYDFLRVLYARAGVAYSYISGEKMTRQSEDQIIDTLLSQFENQKITLLSPLVKGRKGHYRELFEQYKKLGFTKMRVDGVIQDIVPKMQLDRYKIHDIELVIDRIVPKEEDRFRITQSVQLALKNGKDTLLVVHHQKEKETIYFFSKQYVCPTSGISYDEPAPNSFSFNSPYGWCPTCQGLGIIQSLTKESMLGDEKLSISQGVLLPLGEYRDLVIFDEIESLLKTHKLTLSTAWEKIPENVQKEIFEGSQKELKIINKEKNRTYYTFFKGIFHYVKNKIENGNEKDIEWAEDFLETKVCEDCQGTKIKKESRFFKIHDKNIAELSRLNLDELAIWLENIEEKLENRQRLIAQPLLKEIRQRLKLLLDIGLNYLSLERQMKTLSGGEAQRIRLATQIGTQLVGVLYILDEPSIGLHARDNIKLIKSLKALRDLGNSILVVEHDKDMMLEADYLLDIGKGAGVHGGKVIAQGKPKEIDPKDSLTVQYLKNIKTIPIPEKRREGNGKSIILKGAKGNNLKNVTLNIPLGKMICVTGVSGSGKSTLIHETLFPILNQHFFRAKKMPLPYESIEGLKNIDKVIEVDQSPIGRTPRSNPATYTGFFTDIRTLFSVLPESKIRGYKPGRFSFNVKGGRCEDCQGGGMKSIEMEFLADVYVECQTCKGKRYNRETLEVRFKSKSIADVLDMTVENAVEFFENQPVIKRKIQVLADVGLGYLKLGQQATTLSGGEAQRVKLATELSRKETGKTLYILDEPTTGLHFVDIKVLIDVLQKLVDKGNTVLVIEHNLDVIKVADHIIDLGIDGGSKGGEIIFEGTPEEMIKTDIGFTAPFLKMEMERG
jgi:excinuclease ABC subunit A